MATPHAADGGIDDEAAQDEDTLSSSSGEDSLEMTHDDEEDVDHDGVEEANLWPRHAFTPSPTVVGDLEGVKAQVAADPTVASDLLLRVSKHGHVDLVRFLVEQAGADVQYHRTSDRKTALLQATTFGHLPVVRFLVEEAGADVHQRDFVEYTSLHVASVEGHLDVLRYLVLDAGGDVSCVDGKGYTPLLSACLEGYLPIVKFLLEEGGSSVRERTQNDEGFTPLLAAAEGGNLEVVRYLLEEAGCHVSERGDSGLSCFDVADNLSFGTNHVTTWLAEHRAELESASWGLPPK